MVYMSNSIRRPPFYLGAHRRDDATGRIVTAISLIVAGLSVCLLGGCAALVGA